MANDNSNEFVEVTEVNDDGRGLQIYQQDKAAIDMQIVTAKRYPRNLKLCINNAITTVTLSSDSAQSCMYSLKKGGKLITGPSVVLAKILAQEFGNMRIENRVVGYDSTHVTCEATCFDLEKNFAIRTQIKKSIVGNSGRFSEDMCVITGNAGNAIALRNAIFAIIPKAVVDKVYNSARATITGDISDEQKLTARRTAIFAGFKEGYPDLKITDEDICKSVGKQSIAHITSEDILVLIGYENAFKHGEMKAAEVFKGESVSLPQTKPQEKIEEERLIKLINSKDTEQELSKLFKEIKTPAARKEYDAKMKSIKNKKPEVKQEATK